MGLVVHSASVLGVNAFGIEIQADVRRSGDFNFTLVGLPDGAVREAKDRVAAALAACGYTLGPRRIIINLAPSDIRKEGSSFDLPIAVGVLAGVGIVTDRDRLRRYALVGELSLDGRVRGVRGALTVALAARATGLTGLWFPKPTPRKPRWSTACACSR
ncbi:MAG: hypothetical protein M5R36_25820 [Deltaproteobacteria bacterium]|nr:hypothetical protein [Deltaproteobacteria bacterium]